MGKITSSLKNMIIVLFVITFVSGLSLAYVKQITLDPITKAQEQKQIDAIAVVLPAFDNNPLETSQEAVNPQDKNEKMIIYTAIKQSDTVGYAILSATNSGYGGKVEVMIGFNPDGTIYNTAVVDHKETPGLGDKMNGEEFRSQFKGFNCGTQKAHVKKDGGDIDALTAATISSRAFCSTIRNAYEVFCNVTGKKVNSDVDIITLDPIAKTQEQKQIDAIAIVLPAFDNNPIETAQEVENPQDKNEKMIIYTAIKQGKTIGYAILSATESGFGGKIEVMIGFNPDGTIYNTAVVAHKETPGYGEKMNGDEFRSQFIGFNCETQKARVKKDGGDIDALTAATISSRAFCSTVRNAYKVFCNVTGKKVNSDIDDTEASAKQMVTEINK